MSVRTKKTALITGVTGQDGAYRDEFPLKNGDVVRCIKRRALSVNTTRIDPCTMTRVSTAGT